MWHFQDWLVQLGIPTETEWIEGGMGSRLREQMEAIKRCYRNDVWTAPSSSEIPACWSMPAPKKTQHRANAGLFCGQICPEISQSSLKTHSSASSPLPPGRIPNPEDRRGQRAPAQLSR